MAFKESWIPKTLKHITTSNHYISSIVLRYITYITIQKRRRSLEVKPASLRTPLQRPPAAWTMTVTPCGAIWHARVTQCHFWSFLGVNLLLVCTQAYGKNVHSRYQGFSFGGSFCLAVGSCGDEVPRLALCSHLWRQVPSGYMLPVLVAESRSTTLKNKKCGWWRRETATTCCMILCSVLSWVTASTIMRMAKIGCWTRCDSIPSQQQPVPAVSTGSAHAWLHKVRAAKKVIEIRKANTQVGRVTTSWGIWFNCFLQRRMSHRFNMIQLDSTPTDDSFAEDWCHSHLTWEQHWGFQGAAWLLMLGISMYFIN